MDAKQKAAKSRNSETSDSTTPGRSRRKRGSGDGGTVDFLAGSEETPVTMSGGSIHVQFNPPFNDDGTPGKKVGKASQTGIRFTRVVIRRGVGGPILSEYPPPGLELGSSCIIEIKGQKE